jgi:hypothetical protein
MSRSFLTANKEAQMQAMNAFEAGQLGLGEMGTG